jgi:hypothetical protein
VLANVSEKSAASIFGISLYPEDHSPGFHRCGSFDSEYICNFCSSLVIATVNINASEYATLQRAHLEGILSYTFFMAEIPLQLMLHVSEMR